MTATTVTTTAAATATTATSIESAAVLGGVLVVTLILLLVTKELAGASDTARAQRLSRIVNVGALPLLFAFGAIVVAKVLAVLA
jgi:hypothetical protein